MRPAGRTSKSARAVAWWALNMRIGVGKGRLPAASLAVLIGFMGPVLRAEEPQRGPCTEDAMIVFDASGSMAGNENFDIGSPVTRIDGVRSALASVLPSATRWRRVGLITFGPGPYNQCNVQLNLEPQPTRRALSCVP